MYLSFVWNSTGSHGYGSFVSKDCCTKSTIKRGLVSLSGGGVSLPQRQHHRLSLPGAAAAGRCLPAGCCEHVSVAAATAGPSLSMRR